jgi:hypothetical protein
MEDTRTHTSACALFHQPLLSQTPNEHSFRSDKGYQVVNPIFWASPILTPFLPASCSDGGVLHATGALINSWIDLQRHEPSSGKICSQGPRRTLITLQTFTYNSPHLVLKRDGNPTNFVCFIYFSGSGVTLQGVESKKHTTKGNQEIRRRSP